jgi:hypothetical protein
MSDHDRMCRIDVQLAHIWVVRTFLKHSEEAEEDQELQQVHRGLYDFALALGEAWKSQDAPSYLKTARKKLHRLRKATNLFVEIQPDVSGHMNFQMAARSLQSAVAEVEAVLANDAG